jgi:hypothetical protein
MIFYSLKKHFDAILSFGETLTIKWWFAEEKYIDFSHLLILLCKKK